MPVTTKDYRYQLPKKAIKTDCPDCSPKHRKTLSRYIDTKTGEPLPDLYGRCDRESNCGYYLSPYHKGASGVSYADEVKEYKEIPKEWFRMAGKWKRNGVNQQGVISGLKDGLVGAPPEQAEYIARFVFNKPTRSTQTTPAPVIFTLPDEVVSPSLGHYERNQFSSLLCQQFGKRKADELLYQFKIGTSKRWPGACIFWLIDEQDRARAGQVVLFVNDWHKAKYIDKEGNSKVCISSVSYSLIRRFRKQGQPAPDWLTDYDKNAPRWPILFGLHQLVTAPLEQPVAVVEAPKTAVVCSAMIPGFVWLAVGALSYLNAERLAPLRSRSVMLFPDLSKSGKAFTQWSQVANDLNKKGFQITVSDYLEQRATDEQKAQGLDLADFLLMPDNTRPRWIRDGQTIYGEVLTVEPCHNYPAEWDF
ncbi:DUF6371 domain-containing protein [Spirosoma pulveris]